LSNQEDDDIPEAPKNIGDEKEHPKYTPAQPEVLPQNANQTQQNKTGDTTVTEIEDGDDGSDSEGFARMSIVYAGEDLFGSVVDGDTINIQGGHYWNGHQGKIVGGKIVKRKGVEDTAPVYMVEFNDGDKKILTPVGQNYMVKVQKDDNDTKRRLLTILNKL